MLVEDDDDIILGTDRLQAAPVVDDPDTILTGDIAQAGAAMSSGVRAGSPKYAGNFGAIVVTTTTAGTRDIAGVCSMNYSLLYDAESKMYVCTYTLVDLQKLQEPLKVPDGIILKQTKTVAPLLLVVCKFSVLQTGLSCGAYLDTIGNKCTFIKLAAGDYQTWDSCPHVIRRLHLKRRYHYQLLPLYPSWYKLKECFRYASKSRQLLQVSGTQQEGSMPLAADDILLELPGGWKQALSTWQPIRRGRKRSCANLYNFDKRPRDHLDDPVRLVRAYSFTMHLRNHYILESALDAAHCLEHDEDICTRDKSRDICRTTLQRSTTRIDIVTMLLQRRLFNTYVVNDEVQAITVFSDASPVTGSELQGTIVDICLKSVAITRSTLPGSTLLYGHQDAISKSISFLWSSWLIAGPSAKTMRYFLSKVKCITTDFGVEIHMLELPDVLEAFLARVNGASWTHCQKLVVADARLLPNCIRLVGWSHTFGTIMKAVMSECPTWQTKLNKLRSMCKFFGNATWRKFLKTTFTKQGIDVGTRLDNFNASFAKWRYETLSVVFLDLLKLEPIVEHIDICLFKDAQDKQVVAEAIDGCKDKSLWAFMNLASELVIQPLEGMRHWGMVCDCHAEERASGTKHIQCAMNSRRLRKASAFIDDSILEFKQQLRVLILEKCYGSQELFFLMQAILTETINCLHARFKYLKALPWSLCNADTQIGAKLCLDQINRVPLEQHDPYTRMFWHKHGDHLRTLVDSGIVHDDLAEEVRALCLSPLDESAGEGYHRSTNHEKGRAPSSSMQHLKHTTRLNENIKRLKDLFSRHGVVGHAVVRFEWLRWKRILQTREERKWDPRKMETAQFLKRIYKEDDFLDDFVEICKREPVARPVSAIVSLEKNFDLHKEYLLSLIEKHSYYTLDTIQDLVGADGQPVQETVHQYFQIVDIAHSRKRRKMLHTVESADDVSLSLPLALQVQLMSPCSDPSVPAAPANMQSMLHDSDVMWLSPTRLAPMDNWMRTLQKFNVTNVSSDIPGCILLGEPTICRPSLSIMDEGCPTLAIIWHLKKSGWRPVDRLCRHIVGAPKDFDGRNASSKKNYYQVLVALDRCLPLASSIPSAQPILFYRLLLKGCTVEPDLGAKAYSMILKEHAGCAAALALEDVPAPEPDPLFIMDDDTILGVPEVKPIPVSKPGAINNVADDPDTILDGIAMVAAGPPPEAPVVVPVVAPVEPEPAPAADNDDDSVLGGGPAPKAATRRQLRWLPSVFGGHHVTYDEWPNATNAAVYRNWKFKCSKHTNCEKKRGAQFVGALGHLEPLCFLHAWSELDVLPGTGKSHAQLTPDAAHVAQVHREWQHDLEVLKHEFVPP